MFHYQRVNLGRSHRTTLRPGCHASGIADVFSPEGIAPAAPCGGPPGRGMKNLGRFDHDLTNSDRALGIMAEYLREFIPFYGRTIQVSELFQVTQIVLMEVSINRGATIAGWFMMENLLKKDDLGIWNGVPQFQETSWLTKIKSQGQKMGDDGNPRCPMMETLVSTTRMAILG